VRGAGLVAGVAAAAADDALWTLLRGDGQVLMLRHPGTDRRRTTMRTRTLLALSTLLALAPAAALAHHGWSGYDAGQVLSLTGTIREAGYEHPHGFVRLETPDKTWLVVLAPPSRMDNRGLPREMLKAGTKASVVGYPNRSDASEMRAERITIGDKTTELR